MKNSKEYNAAYFQRNKAQLREKRRAYLAEYYRTHKEQALAASRKRRKEKPDLNKEYSRRSHKVRREKERTYNREYYKKNTEVILEKKQVYYAKVGCTVVRRSQEKHRRAHDARVLIADLKKNGKIIQPVNCEQCLEPNIELHAHHEDYNYPRDVIWMCRPCHIARHYEIKKAGIDLHSRLQEAA